MTQAGSASKRPSADPDRGIDRTVAGVVGPAGIVREAAERRRAGRRIGRRRRRAARSAGRRRRSSPRRGVIGIALELAAVERQADRPPPRRASRGVACTTRVVRSATSLLRRPAPGAPSTSKATSASYQAALALATATCHEMSTSRRGQFGDHPVVGVVAEDAEPRRLLGDGAGRILERAGGKAARRFGTEEERVAAVADARHADCRVDGDPPDPIQLLRGERLRPCLPAGWQASPTATQ